MKTNELTFRQLENRICFVYSDGLDSEYSIMLNDFVDLDKANGFLAFVYVDHKDGVLFDVLCNAHIDENGNIEAFDGNNENFLRIRKNAFEDLDIVVLDVTSEYYNVFEYKINTTMAQAKQRSTEVADYVRKMTFLDGSRAMSYPDDLAVLYMSEDKQPEVIWCRVEGMDGNMIQGTVLNDSLTGYPAKQGDTVSFGVAEYMGAPTSIKIIE